MYYNDVRIMYTFAISLFLSLFTMNKVLTSFLYLVSHPKRFVEIVKLYSGLSGNYRFTIILAHGFREAVYRKRVVGNKDIQEEGIDRYSSQMILALYDGVLRGGGLTDRLKGLCTMYRYAKKQNLGFRIYFMHPFNLEKYLVPNTYDWRMEKSEISYDMHDVALYTWETEKLAQPFFQANQDKKQLHVVCNSGESSENYSELFNALFKPSSYLRNKVDFHLDKLGGRHNFISVSFRFQNLLGEFREANSMQLPLNEKENLISRCLDAISVIRKKYNNELTILITSDSNLFREKATSQFDYVYSYVLPEEVGHLDYAKPGKGKELTAFLDMYLISYARIAYQIRSREMYNSDFPNMAAKINNIPYEMVLLA